MKFSELDLDPKVLAALDEAGYETPTPIQEKAIPTALMGRDVLGIAQTGTGKTAAFTLPMITILAQGRARARMPRSLILCPTRELAAQVAENFEIYGKNHKLTMALLIGGVSFKDQDKLIDRGVDVLIATPGRLLDHFERGKLMLTGVQVMVVDEADRMLDMGFIPDIERIFGLTPFTRQTLFFSATMPPEITRLTEQFLHNPERIEVARQSTTSETITQSVVKHTPSAKGAVGEREKRELLYALIKREGPTLTNGIVFCNRKRDVDIVWKSLKKRGVNAGAIHGDLDQSERMRVLSGFRDGNIDIMVASDVAARGLDIPNVSHVFNFDVPIHAEDYVHRIGRTGRAGRSGAAITICFPHEQKHLDKIEELIKQPVPAGENPLGGDAPAQAEEAGDKTDAKVEGERKPRRSRRKRKGEEQAEEAAAETTEATAAEAAAPEAAAEAPQDEAAEAPARDEKPRRRRSRRRKDEGEAEAEAKPAETADAQPEAAAEQARPEAAPVEAQAEAAPAEAQAEDAPAEAPKPARERSRGRRNKREDRASSSDDKPAPRRAARLPEPEEEHLPVRRDRGGRIIGMGDHVPAFIARPIDVAALIRASSRSDDNAPVDTTDEAESDAA
ncbi:DEAD/DEAH box helicase [Rhodovulum sp. DZ06]|uniref:DEAD/DEAH box helicase n=1 Tax=Rhodovulum sp. DZ06 TaxID=3425126 RepID=UPI003D329F64